MAEPDPGPLLEEHLDELQLIVEASERGGQFSSDAAKELDMIDTLDTVDYVLGWHDRHDRQLLEAARWALAHGWKRTSSDHTPS